MKKCISCRRKVEEDFIFCYSCRELRNFLAEISKDILDMDRGKQIFIRISEILYKEKLWSGDDIIVFYTTLIYGDCYNPRDFTYSERPTYIYLLDELKSLTKNREIRKQLQDIIDECERIQNGGWC